MDPTRSRKFDLHIAGVNFATMAGSN
jgi:hypothetical protein